MFISQSDSHDSRKLATSCIYETVPKSTSTILPTLWWLWVSLYPLAFFQQHWISAGPGIKHRCKEEVLINLSITFGAAHVWILLLYLPSLWILQTAVPGCSSQPPCLLWTVSAYLNLPNLSQLPHLWNRDQKNIYFLMLCRWQKWHKFSTVTGTQCKWLKVKVMI